MSGIFNSVASGLGWSSPPDPANEIAIVAGSNRITGWQSVSVTRSVELFPSAFSLTAVDQYPDDPGKATTFPAGPGEKCQITIGGDTVLTGYIDQYATSVGPTQHQTTVTGRGLCQDLVDSSADLVSTAGVNGATLTAATAIDLAQKLALPFHVTARLQDGIDPGKAVGTFTIAVGETAYEIIERVCRFAGYLVYEDTNGDMVLDRVGTNKMASGFAMPGNVESAAATFSFNQRFGTYTVVWSTINQYQDLSPIANNRAEATDPSMPPGRNRQRIIVSSQVTSGQDWAQLTAQWEMARRIGRSQAINLTCDSWRDSAGALWKPNFLAKLNLPAMKVVDVEWIIGTVTFRKDQSGTHADLTLMPRGAFAIEPAPLTLWDAQIMHDLGSKDAASQGAPASSQPASNGLLGRV